ncbi:villin, putative [Entamoeba dispar SAW760]|uniref:Villin, putative n=1 Tax=Entamoeba dispar (strain ATCC PRA-260 / SAW760) TaxID=370354 RepID=B0EQN4_ENTDS|nr:villin, putative [Entamoeba dispar SAW760]EDR23153.1 villin, putative [Entamoeba dispar SAW760]|eukprot:EDR23153.1 villin, putative [Entamoeba dispar SAW760]
MFPQDRERIDRLTEKNKKDPMLQMLTQLYFSKGGTKKITKQELTQVDSALSVKTPEITPTKGRSTSKLTTDSQSLFKKKTERITSRISQDLSSQHNQEVKKNPEVVRKVTEKLKQSVTKENDKNITIQRTPSILRSSIRKSTTGKDEEENTKPTTDISLSSKESQQLVRHVTEELKRTSVTLKRRTCTPSIYTLLLVSQSGNEKNIITVEVLASYSNLNSKRDMCKIMWVIKKWKISNCFQSREPLLFKQLFSDWVEPIISRPKVLNTTITIKKELPPFNVAVLFEETEYKEKKVPEFSSEGIFKKFKVENISLQLVEEEKNRFILRSNECYVFHYTYPWKNLFRHALFFWLGKNASILHRGKAAALTVDYVEKHQLDAVHVRVVEGAEQREFIAMHKGGIVIKKNIYPEKYELYEIRKERGTEGIRIIQINHLNLIDYNRSYIININGKGIIVEGKYCPEYQKIKEIILRSKIVFDCYKDTIENIQKYQNYKEFNYLFKTSLPEFPHAFTISACTGSIEWDGLYELNLQTLQDQRIIVVTFGNKLYFWAKLEVRLTEIIKLLKTMMDYVESAKIKNITLNPLFIRPDEEPEEFKRLFFGNQELKRRNEVVENVNDIFLQLTRKYSLAELQKKPKLLTTVACGSLESFLEDNVFEKVFGMSRDSFAKQPQWKQKNAKARVGLW